MSEIDSMGSSEDLALFVETVNGSFGGLLPEPLSTPAVEWAWNMENTQPLFSWMARALTKDNVLSLSEVKAIEELKSQGKYLKGAALNSAFQTLSVFEGAESIEELEQEVARLEKQLAPLKGVHGNLVTQRDMLASHVTARTHFASQVSSYGTGEGSQAAVLGPLNKKLSTSNASMNSSLEKLSQTCSHVEEVFGSHERDAGRDAKPPALFSHADLAEYLAADDEFVATMGKYIQAQFNSGPSPATLSGTAQDGSNEDVSVRSKWDLLNVKDPTMLLVSGDNDATLAEYAHELSRLRSIYPMTLKQALEASLDLARVQGEFNKATAQEGAAATYSALEVLSLRRKLDELEQVRESMESSNNSTLKVITDLQKELAELWVADVVEGDYDLKLARQQYFFDKQETVLAFVSRALARHQVLAGSMKGEGIAVAQTGRLVNVISKQLVAWDQAAGARLELLKALAPIPPPPPRVTVDSRDAYLMRLYHIVQASPTARLGSSSTAAEGEYAALATLEAGLKNVNEAWLGGLAERASNKESRLAVYSRLSGAVETLRGVLFEGSATQVPSLTAQGLADAQASLNEALTTLQGAIGKLMQRKTAAEARAQAGPGGYAEAGRSLWIWVALNDAASLERAIGSLKSKVEAARQ